MKSANVLWYKSPASCWTEALPIGNGSLGAMVFGKYDEEKIELNLDTLWSGRPYKDHTIQNGFEAYEKAQKLSLEGKNMEAQKLLEKTLLKERDGQTYLPLGSLRIEHMKRIAPIEYVRSLNLETAMHTVSMKAMDRNGEAVRYESETFVSHPANCLVARYVSDEPMSLSVTLDTKLLHTVRAEGEILVLDGQCPGMTKNRREAFKDENGMLFRIACGMKTNGRLRREGAALVADGATEICLVLSAEDSFNGVFNDPVSEGKEYRRPPVERVKCALQTEYALLKNEHIADYQKLYNRVELELGENENGQRPTDERLLQHDAGAYDPSLYTLLYNYARYLAISASRPGTQPMNLQGIWNDKLFAPWASNYTININTQMNYWPILPGNLAELNEPLIRMIGELAQTGKDMARELYHAKGWAAHHNSDLWRQAFPASGRAQWGFWYNGGAWLSRHLYDHYLYTMDEAFLRDTAYPIIRGAAEFYLSLMILDKKGEYILAPSTSPENNYVHPSGEDCSVSESTQMTMSIAKETIENALSCAAKLGISDDFTQEAQEKLSKLYRPKIGNFDRLMEWYTDETDAEIHHRHVSHLYALHPAFEITYEKTPDLAEACQKTLEIRGDDGTGWSLGWKINFWARLRDGNHALKLLDMQLKFVPSGGEINYAGGGGTYLNLFDAHPPFQIDGNFGAASGIMEMLLYPGRDEIILLPALPDKWANGSVKGLKAPGNLEISMKWENGKVKEAEFLSAVGGTYKVRINGETVEMTLSAGERKTFA